MFAMWGSSSMEEIDLRHVEDEESLARVHLIFAVYRSGGTVGADVLLGTSAYSLQSAMSVECSKLKTSLEGLRTSKFSLPIISCGQNKGELSGSMMLHWKQPQIGSRLSLNSSPAGSRSFQVRQTRPAM